MITLIATVVILITSFVFLPQTASLLSVTIADPGAQGKVLRLLMNLRYKLISLLSFKKPLYTGTIDEVLVYPLKSVGFIRAQEWEIDEFGFKYDRQFMLAYWDEKAGLYQAYTLRNAPRFSLVSIDYNFEENWFKFTYPLLDEDGNNPENKYSSFTLPCDVSQEFIDANVEEMKDKPTNLWDIHFDSYSIGKAVPDDFKKAMRLNRPGTTLLYTSKGKLCKTGSPEELPSYRVTHFQDYYPLMLMCKEEVDELNVRLKRAGHERQVEPVQFRPNLVIKGLGKSIDDIYKFRLKCKDGVHNWSTAQKCPRCSIPNVELSTGTFDKTNCVTKTLITYRKIDAGELKYHFLGLYCIHLDSGYTVAVGDKIEVMEEQVRLYQGLH